ncbi:immunoglobulin-binding protein 1-like [Pomacea canaliculata]|uniref:immunoglobulin-binding protein 1-like n=1 Tax=Pomacea canaliculata TaxID=400727 RepID=UPI000D728998|nr:immunoglobulin-binding protein 1-like [Pomacea canaliculata]
MADSNADEDTLASLFQSVWDTYIFLESQEESTGSDKVQVEVRKALAKAEQAINMVNQLQLFSDNEDIDEVATNEIRYMLLPALFAYLHGLNTHASRLESVKKAKSHYRDFLKMCKSYKVSAVYIPVDPEDEEDSTDKSPEASIVKSKDLQAMAVQRHSKIERYRQRKELETRLKDLSLLVEKETVDEETKREFYLSQVKRWINIALDELDSFTQEIQILKHMAQMKDQQGHSHHREPPGAGTQQNPKPLRPFILTKDVLQKKVIGAGYPALPTMTIDEFYEKKVADGTFANLHSGQGGLSLQDMALNPEKAAKEQEEEDAEEERKRENDDPEMLRRARAMDEFKDDHRRGWGNRQNMG